MLFSDTETFLIVPGLLAPPLVVGSFVRPDGQPWLTTPDETCDVIAEAIRTEEVIVGQNYAYDMAVVIAHRPELLKPVFEHYRKGLVRDTQVRQKLLDIAAGTTDKYQDSSGQLVKTSFSLAALAHRHLGLELSKGSDTWRLRYRELSTVPLAEWPPEAVDYSLRDAVVTRDVYFAQGGDIADEIPQTRAAFALHLASVWGIRTDPTKVPALKAKLLAEQESARRDLIAAQFYKAVPVTPAEIKEGRIPEFYGEYKAKNRQGEKRPMRWGKDMAVIQAVVEEAYVGRKIPRTKGGDVCTDADSLEGSGHPLLQSLGVIGGVDKILTTYIPVLEAGVKVPINPGFNVLVDSGRTSSYKPNLQNIPTGRRVGGTRECFVARDGFAFTSIDYDTLELRVLAQWCLVKFGRSKMADALKDGKDLHLLMASNILGISYDEAVRRKKEPEVKDARQLSKALNFGFPGGMGADSVCEYARTNYGVIITPAEAKALKQQFLSTWPEMELYFRYHASLPGLEYGEASIVQLFSGRVRGGVGFCDGCNQNFQGGAADGGKAALFEASYECYVVEDSPAYGSRPVGWIHDELIAEVPLETAHEASARLTEIMIAEMKKFVPDIPITASPVLMKHWSKSAEPVFIDGKLTVWEAPTP